MKNKTIITLLLSFVVVISLASCGNDEKARNTQTNANVSSKKEELFPIKTATRKDCTLAPYIVAIKKGFFAEEGLELVWTGEIPDSEILTSIVTGVNDFHGWDNCGIIFDCKNF